ncbi:MAG: hypothetical protein ABWY25_09175 [Paenisporosarcina sp.]
MRITNIVLNSNNSEIANLSFRDPTFMGQYIAKTIIGLDADEIVSKFYSFGLSSKKRFNDVSIKDRDVVMRIVLNPRRVLNETYSDLRDDLYRAISSSRTGEVTLYFYAGATLVAYLDGFITKFEVPHFSKTAEAQITIKCSNPLMRAVNPVRLDPTDISITNPVVIADSLSTAPHGFKFRLKFTADTTNFVIQDESTPDWKFEIVPGVISGDTGFLTDDVLYFSSEFNAKYLYIIRGGTTYSLVDKIQLGGIWPVLFPGANRFHIISGAFVWEEIEYFAAYWGV